VPRFTSPDPDGHPVEAFLASTMVVGLAEIGDKTQILSLILASRFLRPLPVIFGIFFATLANHAAAGLAGKYFSSLLNGAGLRWILGASFFGVAVWALFPDRCEAADKVNNRTGPFTATLITFSSPKSATRRRSRRWVSPLGLKSSTRS
jgi:putative Ca2+/H+ antiporter (TMEM165/GDT1 family)